MIAMLLPLLGRLAASLGLAAAGRLAVRLAGPLLGRVARALGLPILGRAVSSFAGPLLGRLVGSMSWLRIALIVGVVLAIVGAVGWHVWTVRGLERAVAVAERTLAEERLANAELRAAIDEQTARLHALQAEAERSQSRGDVAVTRRLHIPRAKPTDNAELNDWIAKDR